MLTLGDLLGLVLRHERESSFKAQFSRSPKAGGGRGEKESLICRGGRGDAGLVEVFTTSQHLAFTARTLQKGNTTS